MDFAAQIDAWCGEAEARVEKVVRGTLIEMARELVLNTPVGQPEHWRHKASPEYLPGTARGGWHYSSGAPVVRLPVAPDAAGEATVAAIVASLPQQCSGKVHYFSNDVPYIEELERGYSFRQAPNGWIRLTALKFERIVDNCVVEVE